MHAVGSVVFWIALVLHVLGVVGIAAGVMLKLNHDKPSAPTAIFHSTMLMLVSGLLLIAADMWKDDPLDPSQNSIIGIKVLLLLVMAGIAFWLRREVKKPAQEMSTVDGQTVKVKTVTGAGPAWAYYAIALLLVMNFTMGLVVAYVL
jgi:hypothetical protein